MHNDMQLALAGLGLGGIYAVMAAGLLITYRGSGILNFGYGATATVGAYTFLRLAHGNVPKGVAVAGGVAASAAVGALFHATALRALFASPMLAKVTATLGLFVSVTAAIPIVFGQGPPERLPGEMSLLPTGRYTLPFGSPQFVVGADRVWVLFIAIGMTLLLWALFKYTRFGLATRAGAENDTATALLGYSPYRLSLANWTLGSAVGGLAGVMVAMMTVVSPLFYTQILVTVFAAALLGAFRSFSLTLLGGLLVGVVQSVALGRQSDLLHWTKLGGWADSLPFFVIAFIIIARGRSLPLRGFVSERLQPSLPVVSSPAQRAVVALAGGIAWFLFMPRPWLDPMTVTIIAGLVCLSLVVLTGYVGQISLAQMAFAGVGSFATARIATELELPFPLPLILGALVAAPVGFLLGLPALRVRGISLAVVTLAAGLAIQVMIFADPRFTHRDQGSRLPAARLGPFDLNGISQLRSFGMMVLVVAVATAFGVAYLRRSSTGLRMLAVRANERGASGSGVSVARTKLVAFSIAAAIAGLAGSLQGYRSLIVSYNSFGIFDSILIVALAYVGGIGSIGGAFLGGALASGGVLAHVFGTGDFSSRWLPVIYGVSLVGTLVMYPDGLAGMVRSLKGAFSRVSSRWRSHPEMARSGEGGAQQMASRDANHPEPLRAARSGLGE